VITTPHWYAVWTRSRHEKIVRDQLARKHVEVFLPTIGRWSHWKDRKKKIDWPLFPGYCFARFVPDNEHRLDVLKCDGVVSIIGNEGLPSPIPEIEIESIRTLVESELAYDPVPLIKEGDMVKVTHGPLRGVVGRLVRKGAHARLILSVELIGRAVSVEVDASDVKAY
jgi:transcription antitermination factor NusG